MAKTRLAKLEQSVGEKESAACKFVLNADKVGDHQSRFLCSGNQNPYPFN
jgi:hypothetical protein